MKRYFFYLATLWMLCLFTACTEVANEVDYPSIGSSTGTEGESESRIKASVTLSETNRLDAQLEAALGAEQKYLVQDLTISGTFYGVDVETLHKLTQLESVDMSDAVLSGEALCNYGFTEMYDELTGAEEAHGYGGNLVDNCLSNYFFCGMRRLSQIVLPNTISHVGYMSMAGTSIQKMQIPSSVASIDGEAFRFCKQLKVLLIPSTVTSVGGSFLNLVAGCDKMSNLVWNTAANITFRCPNTNCILHLVGDGANANILNEDYGVFWPRVARDGQIDELNLSHSEDIWSAVTYYNGYEYKAKTASLSMYFHRRETSIDGTPCGWRTIVIPFDVDSIFSEQRGLLAPFGSEVEGAKPFWLRELTVNGFVNATSIKANKPYIMALPNNPIYSDEYNIEGLITFTAENATIGVTPDILPAAEGPDYDLQPTYEYVAHSRDVFALNYNYEIRNVRMGSVFANMSADIYPFEAYAKPKNGTNLTEVASAFTIGSSTSTRTVKSDSIKRAPLPDDM